MAEVFKTGLFALHVKETIAAIIVVVMALQ